MKSEINTKSNFLRIKDLSAFRNEEMGPAEADKYTGMLLDFLNKNMPFFSVFFVLISAAISIIYTDSYLGLHAYQLTRLLDVSDIFRYYFSTLPWYLFAVFLFMVMRVIERRTPWSAAQFLGYSSIAGLISYFLFLIYYFGTIDFSHLIGMWDILSFYLALMFVLAFFVNYDDLFPIVGFTVMAAIALFVLVLYTISIGVVSGGALSELLNPCVSIDGRDHKRTEGRLILIISRGVIIETSKNHFSFLNADNTEEISLVGCVHD